MGIPILSSHWYSEKGTPFYSHLFLATFFYFFEKFSISKQSKKNVALFSTKVR